MEIRLDGAIDASHLTYCTNIHPGETWTDVRANLERYIPAVRERLGVQERFGVGLRLSDRASRELDAADELARLKRWLAAENAYVFTINGFPYGEFHGRAVKQNVYRPDWLETERERYTDRLATQLARLLPENLAHGSVSTVPGALRERVVSQSDAVAIAVRIAARAAMLWHLRGESGRRITLALEPEPGCHLETVDEALAFFDRHLLGEQALATFSGRTGLSSSASADALREHVGLCLDTCHAAVEFEDPDECVAKLERSGWRVHKMQLSAGLLVERVDDVLIEELRALDDGVYLHQVVERRGTRLNRYLDLPQAFNAIRSKDAMTDETPVEWRVHCHVPLFRRDLGLLRNTQDFLVAMLDLLRERRFTDHLEVETYTWTVLPQRYRGAELVDDIAREIDWVRRRLQQ